MKNMKRWSRITFLTIFYKVFYGKTEEGDGGWFIRKRLITMILISPILMPIYAIYGIRLYWHWATNYQMHWISDEKRKLSFMERIEIKHRLAEW
jgi:hypothetical protein